MKSNQEEEDTSLSLSFNNSKDLTDNYQDLTTTSISTLGNRHPKGNSPLSLNQVRSNSSINDWDGNNSISTYGTNKNENDSNGNGISLEKLLDFLDEEEFDVKERRNELNSISRGSISNTESPRNVHNLNTSSTSPSQNKNNNNNSFNQHQSQRQPSSDTNPNPTRYEDPNQYQQGYDSFGAINPTLYPSTTSTNQQRNSRSPSPLRFDANRDEVNGNGTDLKRKGRAYIEMEGEVEQRRRTGVNGIPLSDEVLEEFTAIVDQGSPNSRPHSRLRDISSPNYLSSTHATVPSERNGTGEGRYTQNRMDEDQIDVMEELREAKEYILHLQSEMREINSVVKELKKEPRVPFFDHSNSIPFKTNGTNTASRDTIELAKHLFALLPPPTSTTPLLPSLHSIILALEFTRSIDTLVNSPSNERSERRDEEIFIESNLDGLERRLKGWERAVRDH